MKSVFKKTEKYLVVSLCFLLIRLTTGLGVADGYYIYAILLLPLFHRTTWAILKLLLIRFGSILTKLIGAPISYVLYILVIGFGRVFTPNSRKKRVSTRLTQEYHSKDLEGPY